MKPIDNKSKKNKLTPRDLVKKHIEEKDHVVTEEELKNVVVGSAAGDEEEVKKQVDILSDEVDNLSHHHTPPNPYDVL